MPVQTFFGISGSEYKKDCSQCTLVQDEIAFFLRKAPARQYNPSSLGSTPIRNFGLSLANHTSHYDPDSKPPQEIYNEFAKLYSVVDKNV